MADPIQTSDMDSAARHPSLPLAGVRVIDFTHHAAGPMCTMLLGDYGAEVIKIEPPGGEAFRSSGTVRVQGEHVGFLALNRNKKSVELNLKSEAGQRAARDLIRDAHVVVENFRPGKMARIGLDYHSLLAVNPRLIYCSLSAFGATGPYSHKQGLDVVLQAMSGLMSITGEPDGGPLPAGAPIADITSGIFGALGVVLAVLEQRRSGEPQHVEIAMFECMISMLNLRYQQMFAEKRALSRIGASHPQASPWDVYQAADGQFVIAATRDEYWYRMCEGLGIGEYARDPRFVNIKSRVANRAQVNALLNDLFKTRPRQYWLELLDEAQVPNGPVNNLQEVLNDEQAKHNGTFISMQHPISGEIETIAPPIRINGRAAPHLGPPALGNSTAAILRELNLAIADFPSSDNRQGELE
ncbi:CaiB/BaiF CoA transferase family protein [Candidimonas nitroreducens]|uniref:CaiB/BaiF CoA transferase family protein n=1 Tax=Candidimonas nitroreducens TaxID=683354 RepID=UPI001178B9F5|nr:CoA transferase [Candidimonas nitroreducens]